MDLKELKKRKKELEKELELVNDKIVSFYKSKYKYCLSVPVFAPANAYTTYIKYSNSKKELKHIKLNAENYTHPADMPDVKWSIIDENCDPLDYERPEIEGIELDKTKCE